MTGLTQEQLDVRRNKVMASDVSAYLGMSPYGGPLSAWALNLGIETFEGNENTVMGLFLEPALIQLAAQRLGNQPVNQPGSVFHSEMPWAGCTPDAMFPDLDEGVQIKNSGLHQARHYDGLPQGEGYYDNDIVPEWHLCQCLWEMYVTGKSSWWLGCFFGGSDFRMYHLKRDQALLDMMVERLHEFWEQHLDQNGPLRVPPADGSDASTEYLKRAFPRAKNDDLLSASDESIELAIRYQEASDKAKEWGAAKQEARNLLVQQIGDAPGIQGVCTFKVTKPKPKCDWEGLARNLHTRLTQAEERPAGAGAPVFEKIAEKFTSTPGPTRTFRITYKPENTE